MVKYKSEHSSRYITALQIGRVERIGCSPILNPVDKNMSVEMGRLAGACLVSREPHQEQEKTVPVPKWVRTVIK